jgi:hypothetical protein
MNAVPPTGDGYPYSYYGTYRQDPPDAKKA